MSHPIPDDLKERHNQLRVWLESPQQYREERPGFCALEDEMQDIERIAALTAELRVAKQECERSLASRAK